MNQDIIWRMNLASVMKILFYVRRQKKLLSGSLCVLSHWLWYRLTWMELIPVSYTHLEQEVRHSRRLDALARITSYMREHYQEELKLTDVANMFGYSDAYLSRMFQKYANVNFKTYLQDIRMTYAYRELLNSDKTISQIAMDNGFSSSRAFTREFQKRYGILPSEVEREK